MRFLPASVCTMLILLAAAPPVAKASFKLELHDGDRVVFLGGALIEREQIGGYIETMLTTRFPKQNVIFRNLGYSGDTVSGDARGLCTGWSTFESPEQGLNRLRKIFREISPTVLIVNYGMNESFGGPEKLHDFVAGYNKLLDMLESDAKGGTGAGLRQIILLSPNFHEDLGRPLPDPSEHNQNLKLYCKAIADLAAKRNCAYIDLYFITESLFKIAPLTTDGIHLSPYGYWRLALELEDAFNLTPHGDAVVEMTDAASFEGPSGQLPPVPPPAALDDAPHPFAAGQWAAPGSKSLYRSTQLKPGTYVLSVNDELLAKGTAQQWAKGIMVSNPLAERQAEKLRQLIIAKNFDFFNYWRPENDSYILSFRKKEQGQNAVELPKFKPLVEEKEAEIAKDRTPTPITYKLARVGD